MATRSVRRRVIGGIAAGATVALIGAMLTTAAGAAAPKAGTSALPSDLTLVATKHSLTGTHKWYQQTFKGLPVIGGYYAEHLDKAGTVSSVADGRDAVPANLVTTASIAAATATRNAHAAVSARAATRRAGHPKDMVATPAAGQGQARLAVVGGKDARLVWAVVSRSSEGVTRSLVDARSGQTVDVKVLSQNADGTGRVFDPNPVVTLQDESLTDMNDQNQDALSPAYLNVVLPRLDGSGTLSGQYVKIVEAKGGLAKSSTNTFVYERHSDKFEQVESYYAVDKSQDYIHKLGFSDVNNEAQDFSINTFAGDNSFYDPEADMITMGEGGVDDAEDAEVIWHEYGHAIQDDVVPGFGETEQAGAIGEGFGDYWAVTMSVPTSRNFELPCVMDWDSTSYTSTVPHCLRRTDTGKTTDDIEGEVHADGEIWSNALWDIHKALGRDRADKVILEATFFYDPDTSFADAATDTVQAARLLYGGAVAAVVTKAFKDRKIL
jgi:Zn-dependent metalloprotease